MTEWMIKAREFVSCNCSYGCPCQFNALPTHGNCEAAASFLIDEGHFGDVDLGGVRAAAVYSFPGAIHEGNGTMQLIIDKNADDGQREAMLKIMRGEETEPMTTMWSVFTTMCTNILEPLSKSIELEIDVDERIGQAIVPGVFESIGAPIRNPVTDKPHRARIDLPHGFEYSLAEIGSATTKATGEIKFNLNKTYAQFANIHLSNKGVVRKAA